MIGSQISLYKSIGKIELNFSKMKISCFSLSIFPFFLRFEKTFPPKKKLFSRKKKNVFCEKKQKTKPFSAKHIFPEKDFSPKKNVFPKKPFHPKELFLPKKLFWLPFHFQTSVSKP